VLEAPDTDRDGISDFSGSPGKTPCSQGWAIGTRGTALGGGACTGPVTYEQALVPGVYWATVRDGGRRDADPLLPYAPVRSRVTGARAWRPPAGWRGTP
jgi:hypothetical protein